MEREFERPRGLEPGDLFDQSRDIFPQLEVSVVYANPSVSGEDWKEQRERQQRRASHQAKINGVNASGASMDAGRRGSTKPISRPKNRG